MRVPAVLRRQQLIEAAVRLMGRDGVEKTSLRAIAREAGAPLASVHYCFDSRDELMREAVEYWLAELVGTLVEDVNIESGLRATVKRIADGFWTSLEANPPNVLAQLEVALWAMRGESHLALSRGIYPRYGEVLGNLFDRACAAAGETPLISPVLLARSFVGIIDAASLQYLADPASAAPRQIYDLMINSLLDAAGIDTSTPPG